MNKALREKDEEIAQKPRVVSWQSFNTQHCSSRGNSHLGFEKSYKWHAELEQQDQFGEKDSSSCIFSCEVLSRKDSN